ncbi:substrate-binding periplasmic protein [Vibrio sonorensis]|uniref:substrate-binding periplasmic protein n=1 Tax=Vibrio sonorensis TaxID=1004316 RepID=UPI0008D9E5E8|nr:transporter substrate-binding domain-containing protein [Vibrio sonorensis]
MAKFRVLLIALVLTLSSPTLATLTVMTEDFPPFGYINKDEQLTGIAVEMVQFVMKELELEQEIQVLPWSRAMKRIETQSNMVLFSVARTEEREAKFRWVGPLLSDGVYFYHRSTSTQPTRLFSDAKTWDHIAVTDSYPEHAFLENHGFTNLWLTSNPSENVRLLIGGRVDAFVAGEFAVPNLLSKQNIAMSSVKNSGIKLFDVDLYIAFSKDTPQTLLDSWQVALDKLKKSPEFTKIRQRYTRPHESK